MVVGFCEKHPVMGVCFVQSKTDILDGLLNVSHLSFQSTKFQCYQIDAPLGNETFTTRKSSCVNARGIPTAVYQVLPEVGYPPCRGTSPIRSDGGRGTRGGVPLSGYPPARYNGGGCT